MDRFDLKNRVAVVTGGSRGIGKAIALAFGEAGATVVVAARKVDLLAEVVKEVEARGGKGLYVASDLTRDEDIDRLIKEAVERCGRIDILVNNSGISPFVKKSEEVTKEMWQDVLQVNLLAPFMLCREAAKIMMKQNWGRIINMASVGGILGLPRQIAYCATKAAVYASHDNRMPHERVVQLLQVHRFVDRAAVEYVGRDPLHALLYEDPVPIGVRVALPAAGVQPDGRVGRQHRLGEAPEPVGIPPGRGPAHLPLPVDLVPGFPVRHAERPWMAVLSA